MTSGESQERERLAERRRAVLESIVEAIGMGTVANGRVFFSYEEMVEIAPCIPETDA